MTPLLRNLADQYFAQLPERIKDYLINKRGIAWPIICGRRIGWHRGRITIPVYDRQGKLAFFKLAKDPEDASDASKMLCWPQGAKAELYGWEHMTSAKKNAVVICEGEYDRLVLESRGVPAVSSTGGAMTFEKEWATYFTDISKVYICYDNDAAGQRGANRVARLIPHARVVVLPDEVGEQGDVTDFFVRLKKAKDDFFKLLEKAEPLPTAADIVSAQAQGINGKARLGERNPIAEEIKANVRIEDIVSRYVTLRKSGERYVGRCCFHDDRIPSLVVYPKTNSFYCFGCSKAGDVIQFVMEVEHIGFPQALKLLGHYTETL